MITVTIMKKQKIRKTQVGIFKNMGGNVPRGNFLRGKFPGRNSPGESSLDGNFPSRSFPDTISIMSARRF